MTDGSPAGPPGAKVALVHDWLTGMRGGENVLESLAQLFPHAPIFTLFHFPGTVSAALEARTIRTSFLQHAPFVRRHYRYYLGLFPRAIEALDLQPFDFVLSSSHCVAKGVVTARSAFHLCYCHTPVRYAWDQQDTYFPNSRGPVARLRSGLLSRLRRWDAATADRVDHYVANSHFVRERIARYYGRDASVVHPPVDVEFFLDAPQESAEPAEPYCLSVAALAPYKRVDLAIAACERAGLRLVVVGEGPERERLEGLAGDRTRFVGRVDRARLRELYRGATALIQAGVEDFGISSAEALASGTPVVGLGRGGLVDIVHDGEHGVLVDEATPDSLAQAIDKCRALRFNPLNLRARARSFAGTRFTTEIRETVVRHAPEELVMSLGW